MSDNKPYFDKEKQQKALDWLDTKWKDKKCECCKQDSWTISDFLIASPRFEGAITIGGKVSPQVIVTCNNCGNTKLFNAMVMQILEAENV